MNHVQPPAWHWRRSLLLVPITVVVACGVWAALTWRAPGGLISHPAPLWATAETALLTLAHWGAVRRTWAEYHERDLQAALAFFTSCKSVALKNEELVVPRWAEPATAVLPVQPAPVPTPVDIAV